MTSEGRDGGLVGGTAAAVVGVVGVDGHRCRCCHVVWVKGVSSWFLSGVPCRRTRHRCCAENRRDEEGGNPPRHIVVPANVQN